MIITKSKTILVTAILSICLLGAGFYYAHASDQDADLEKYIEVQCAIEDLSGSVGQDSILPDTYGLLESYKLAGTQHEDAKSKAKERLLTREATYWYAVSKGFELSEKEMKGRFDELISELQKTEEYNNIVKLYKKKGHSFEDNIFGNYRFYEAEFIIDELYVSLQEKYNNGNIVFNGKEYDAWQEYWDAVQSFSQKKYKETNNYKIFNKAVDNAIDMWEDGTTVKAILDKKASSDKVAAVADKTSAFDKLSYKHVNRRNVK